MIEHSALDIDLDEIPTLVNDNQDKATARYRLNPTVNGWLSIAAVFFAGVVLIGLFRGAC